MEAGQERGRLLCTRDERAAHAEGRTDGHRCHVTLSIRLAEQAEHPGAGDGERAHATHSWWRAGGAASCTGGTEHIRSGQEQGKDDALRTNGHCGIPGKISASSNADFFLKNSILRPGQRCRNDVGFVSEMEFLSEFSKECCHIWILLAP
jgi:hypothetical protein